MIRNVLIYPEPILARACAEVPEVTDDVRRLLNDMEETMLACRGSGLAAPQIGFPLRIVVALVRDAKGYGVLKLVNPRIMKRSEATALMKEGCLSLPKYFEQVRRHRHVVVEALDETGTKVEVVADGILAHALQHELDHLDGKVFVDHLSPLKRNLARTKFSKAKKAGMCWQSEKPAPRDFTDPKTEELPSRAAELLAAVGRTEAPPTDPAPAV
jgi:peptide deformylase